MYSKEEITQLLSLWTIVAKFYNQNFDPTKEQAEVLADVLSDYDFDAVKKAINEHMKISKFMPTPADIIERIKRYKGLDDESRARKAGVFFDEFCKSLSSTCDYVVADPEIAGALRATFGELRFLADHDSSSFTYNKDKKDFMKAYQDNTYRIADSKEMVFTGNRYGDFINVYFIGTYNDCIKIAQDFYSKTGLDKKYKINYPLRPEDRRKALGLDENNRSEIAPKQFTDKMCKILIHLFTDCKDIRKQALDMLYYSLTGHMNGSIDFTHLQESVAKIHESVETEAKNKAQSRNERILKILKEKHEREKRAQFF